MICNRLSGENILQEAVCDARERHSVATQQEAIDSGGVGKTEQWNPVDCG